MAPVCQCRTCRLCRQRACQRRLRAERRKWEEKWSAVRRDIEMVGPAAFTSMQSTLGPGNLTIALRTDSGTR
jgi:hypothetical protein